jgi:hypothetical protein
MILLSAALGPNLRRAHADIAVLPTGEKVNGSLGQSPSGHVSFMRSDKKTELLPQQIEYVRFSDRPVSPLRAAALHRITLRDGQQFTGDFQGLDQREVHFRTAWKDRLTLARSAVLAIEQAPGYSTFFVDDFEGTLAAWRLTGMPKLSDRYCSSGRHSLCLDQPGQAAEFVLPEPLEKGRVGINFFEQEVATGSRCAFELKFEGKEHNRVVHVLVDSDDGTATTEVTGTSPRKSKLPKSPGWHRLFVEFTDQSLAVAVDEAVLWFGRQSTPGGTLRTIKLSWATAANTAVGGQVFFDDFGLARALQPKPRPPGDSQQDEIWLVPGDQVFCDVLTANNRAIDYMSRSVRRSASWRDVRGIYLRSQATTFPVSGSDRFRIWLRSGAGGDPDQIEGSIRRLDDKHLVLRHEILGEMEIDIQYLHRVKWLGKP